MPESRKLLAAIFAAVVATFLFVWWIRPDPHPVTEAVSRPIPGNPPTEEASSARADVSDDRSPGPPGRSRSESAAEALERYVRKVHEVSQTIDDAGQDLLQLSPSEQQQIGQFLHQQTLAVAETIEGEPKVRVQSVLEGILKVHGVSTDAVILTILRADALNAFAHVGGYIYVYSPLLDFTPDDAELEFVLGHEVGHLLLGHCARKVTYVARAYELNENVANAAALAYQIISAGYSEQQEFAADEFGLQTQFRLGRTAEPALRFLQRFADFQEARGQARSRPRTDTLMDRLRQAVDDHLRTHPYDDERLSRLRTLQP